jgi:hypothetical protein
VRGSYRRLQRAVPSSVAAGGGVRSCGSGERGKWREVRDDRWDRGVGERERGSCGWVSPRLLLGWLTRAGLVAGFSFFLILLFIFYFKFCVV